MNVYEAMEYLEDWIDYAKFNDFKDKFLRTFKLEWLICGHLNESRAQDLFDIVK